MNRITCFVTLLAVSSAFAQDVPPPPKPAEDGPTLEVTMKYIQDRLNGQGKVIYEETLTLTYTDTLHRSSDRYRTP